MSFSRGGDVSSTVSISGSPWARFPGGNTALIPPTRCSQGVRSLLPSQRFPSSPHLGPIVPPRPDRSRSTAGRRLSTAGSPRPHPRQPSRAEPSWTELGRAELSRAELGQTGAAAGWEHPKGSLPGLCPPGARHHRQQLRRRASVCVIYPGRSFAKPLNSPSPVQQPVPPLPAPRLPEEEELALAITRGEGRCLATGTSPRQWSRRLPAAAAGCKEAARGEEAAVPGKGGAPGGVLPAPQPLHY